MDTGRPNAAVNLGEVTDERTSAEPTRQQIFETLSNERRRMVAHTLRARGTMDLRDLSRVVAAWENDIGVEAVDSAQRRRVYNALQQSHLPKMDERNVVSYDHARGTIAPTDSLSDLTVYLEVVPDRDISWSTYYILLGTVLTLLCSAVALDLYPFSLFGLEYTAVVSTLLVVVSGVAHRIQQNRMALGAGEPPV